MKTFKGFTESETFTQLPDTFFHQLLNEIDDAAELKVTLYFLWRAEHLDGPFRALQESDFEAKDLGLSANEVHSGLESAVKRGSILQVEKDATIYFLLNSPRGRAAAETFAKGELNQLAGITSIPLERPNIFEVYEKNIGPLTSIIADRLKDAEDTYSGQLVLEAIEEAVLNNARSWKYCEAVLKNWKENGRAKKQDGRDNKKPGEQSLDRKIEQLRKRTQK